MEQKPSLEERLSHLLLKDGDINPSILQESPEDSQDATLTLFHGVFQAEIRNLEEKGTPVDKQRKQQILADILVWAEITQAHYNQEVQRFVTQPNEQDESFQRVGRMLQEAKKRQGIPNQPSR
eukprot:CAMPEP_0202417798 /NCGR_PEP_ID=MMETSP1128-20130828/44167_1 /ASSEMBLY_ACC=CAM_ASM_000463 /TAXON_ID=3047 /ORGANISM="Dunaliella tertiolecta, Strain CCMP1320" /LENGTH=122 /DNA_ID=CAMNT_0049025211 /DNA_START=41 /DNA_END=409 /DNA_ORIENTATION=-